MVRTRTTRVLLLGAVAGALIFLGPSLGAPASVWAAPAAPDSRTVTAETHSRVTPGVPLVPASLPELKSDDMTAVKAGLDAVRLSGPRARAAAPQIAALLRSGLPYPLAEAAIDTLVDIEAPDAAAAILPYARHREARVRRAAVRALGKPVAGSDPGPSVAALERALEDPDPLVRAAAATGLGALAAKSAVKSLFLALDRQVVEAAASIGRLCDVRECDALVARLGRLPFEVITPALGQVLARPASEVSDEAKVNIVQKIRDVGTRDANRFLREVQAGGLSKASPAVRREVDAAVAATSASPGGAP